MTGRFHCVLQDDTNSLSSPAGHRRKNRSIPGTPRTGFTGFILHRVHAARWLPEPYHPAASSILAAKHRNTIADTSSSWAILIGQSPNPAFTLVPRGPPYSILNFYLLFLDWPLNSPPCRHPPPKTEPALDRCRRVRGPSFRSGRARPPLSLAMVGLGEEGGAR